MVCGLLGLCFWFGCWLMGVYGDFCCGLVMCLVLYVFSFLLMV